jgi:hypothetical protein
LFMRLCSLFQAFWKVAENGLANRRLPPHEATTYC